MLNNIDSRLNVSLKKQRLYEKQTKKAESILERQFGGSAYRCIIGSIEKKWSLSESLPIFKENSALKYKLKGLLSRLWRKIYEKQGKNSA